MREWSHIRNREQWAYVPLDSCGLSRTASVRPFLLPKLVFLRIRLKLHLREKAGIFSHNDQKLLPGDHHHHGRLRWPTEVNENRTPTITVGK